MVDTQTYNFTVKSRIHDYHVNFITDLKGTLETKLIEGDVLIIDNKIKELYNEEFASTLCKYTHIGIDSNEPQKSYQQVESVINQLISGGFKKNHRLVAVGGGITQDVTAFIASILYRGVSWLFFPTSLLAQGDSCIGSKTSINFGEYKNLVGGFYPPNDIYVYPDFLNTLLFSELQSGLGEMLHYFIVSSEEDFERYKHDYPAALKDKKVLAGIIARSLEIKKSYIEIDEFDRKERQVFNYGHSFGHAIESMTNYEIPHGIAVSFGMDMSNYVSVKKGYISEDVRQNIRGVVEKIWEGYTIKNLSIDQYLVALSKDKKNVGSKLGLILSKGYGKIFKDLTDSDQTFRGWMEDYFENEL
jgi:3-dehydroquinate synthase